MPNRIGDTIPFINKITKILIDITYSQTFLLLFLFYLCVITLIIGLMELDRI